MGNNEDTSYVWVSGGNPDVESYPEKDRVTSQRYITLMTNFATYL